LGDQNPQARARVYRCGQLRSGRLGGSRRHKRRIPDHRRNLCPGRLPHHRQLPGLLHLRAISWPVRRDIGANGSCNPAYLCTAGPGYDGPTGLGTPDGLAAFTTGGGPGYEAAFQANTGHLWVEGSGGTGDTGLSMMPGTSPVVTEMPPGNNLFLPSGGFVAVFHQQSPMDDRTPRPDRHRLQRDARH
jgi:hypothetical protein